MDDVATGASDPDGTGDTTGDTTGHTTGDGTTGEDEAPGLLDTPTEGGPIAINDLFATNALERRLIVPAGSSMPHRGGAQVVWPTAALDPEKTLEKGTLEARFAARARGS